MKKIAIVITTFNGEKFLPKLISSLKKINYPQEFLKIVFTEDGSVDGTSEYIKKEYPEAILLNHENVGFCASNNIGLTWALNHSFDYVMLLNQDTEVDSDCLVELANVLESDDKIGAVQACLMEGEDKTLVNSIGNKIHFLGFGYSSGGYQKLPLAFICQNPYEVIYPSNAATLFRAEALRKIGLLDEYLWMYHDDMDFGLRLWYSGYRVMLAPRAIVYHYYEFGRSIQKYYWMERNRFVFLLKFFRWPTLFLIGPMLDLMEIGLFVFALKSGWWREKIRVYRFLFNSKNLAIIFQKRREIQEKRTIKDKEILRRMTGVIKFQAIDNLFLKYIGNPLLAIYFYCLKLIIWW